MAWVLHTRKISLVASQKEKDIKDEIKRKRAKKPRARELGGQEELHDAERQCDRNNLTQSCG